MVYIDSKQLYSCYDLKQIHKDIKIKDKILLEKVKEIDALKTANRTIE